MASDSANTDTLVFIRGTAKESAAVPLVLTHDGGGTIFSYFTLGSLGRHLYGISNPHFDSKTAWEGGIPEVAQQYCDMIKKHLPKGRILLGGWSFGALISLEICRILVKDSDYNVVGLIMIDSPNPKVTHGRSGIPTKDLPSIAQHTRPQIREKVLASMENSRKLIREWQPPQWDASSPPPPAILVRADQYVPIAEGSRERAVVDLAREDPKLGWEEYDALTIQNVIEVPGHHFSIFHFDRTDAITKAISDACDILTG